MNRREFLVGSTAALLVSAAGGSYVFSSCPLDADGSGVCTGPCAAFIDFDGDGFCDRLPVSAQVAEAGAGTVPTPERACPFGLLNDPYPGLCNLYVDADGDGVCDLSQKHAGEKTSSASESNQEVAIQPSPSAGTILTACPLGLINDPFPGECRRYVDKDGNNICDLSEPELIASGAIVPLATPTQSPATEPGVTPPPRPMTACPYGLVNDPYPGECRQYVDDNGNGICDLSEPELVASGAVVAPSAVAPEHSTNGRQGQSSGQGRRRGQNNN